MKLSGGTFGKLGLSFTHENVRSANFAKQQKKLDDLAREQKKKGYLLEKTSTNENQNTDKTELSKSAMRIQKRMTEQSLIAQRIAEDESNRDRVGERILKKAESGKELSPKEMNYLAEKYPEAYRKIRMAQMEREMLKQQMEAAKDEIGVEMAYAQAIARVRDTADGGQDVKLRVNQLTDEYRQFKNGEDKKDEEEYSAGERAKMALNDARLLGGTTMYDTDGEEIGSSKSKIIGYMINDKA